MKLLSRYILVLFMLSAASMAQAAGNLVGSWKGTDTTGTNGGFTFKANGQVVMDAGGQIIESNAQADFKYNVDNSKSPTRITLQLFDKASGSLMVEMHLIYEFISGDKLRLGIVNDPAKFPKSFSEVTAADQIELNRM